MATRNICVFTARYFLILSVYILYCLYKYPTCQKMYYEREPLHGTVIMSAAIDSSLSRLRQLPAVQQRRAACLLGALVADTAGKHLPALWPRV